MSGQAVCRIGDTSLGSCGKPPIPAISSNSTNVLVNGIPVINVGSYWGTHCTEDCHSEFTVVGNSSVLVNGTPIVTIGKYLSNGDITGTGSPNVLA